MGSVKWMRSFVRTISYWTITLSLVSCIGCSNSLERPESKTIYSLSDLPSISPTPLLSQTVSPPVSSLPPRLMQPKQAMPSLPLEQKPLKQQARSEKEHPKQIVKGIYVSAWSAVGAKFEKLLNLVDKTDLNAMVIDIKNDSGQVTYSSAVPFVNEIGANSNIIIKDLQAKLQLLKSKQIYTIARIVVFKDPYLSKRRKQYALKTFSGDVWRDKKNVTWVDPYKEEVWDYNIQIAKEAAELGFDEIQFDYVRFPENGKQIDKEVRFDNRNNLSKTQVIEGFLKKAKEEVGTKAYLSADVFGLTTSSNNDMGIGQDWLAISNKVDFISPMLYPSHYASGVYGIKNPDAQPYAVISKAVGDAKSRNNQLEHKSEHMAEIRPWYQDFTATWVQGHKTYGLNEVKAQINAAKEQGVEQFLLWNANSTYSYR